MARKKKELESLKGILTYAPKVDLMEVESAVVGIDIGYGFVKAHCVLLGAVNSRGEHQIIHSFDPLLFPSVMMAERAITFMEKEIMQTYPGDTLYESDGTHFVGNLAVSQGRQAMLRSLQGTTNDTDQRGMNFRTRLLKVAIGKFFSGLNGEAQIPLVIGTGLPVDHMGQFREVLREAIRGTGLMEVNTDTCQGVFAIERVFVMPQPYGILYRHTIAEDGKANRKFAEDEIERIGVLDGGQYSVDIIGDRRRGTLFVPTLSGSVDHGMYEAEERLNEAIAADEKRGHGRLRQDKLTEVMQTGSTYIKSQEVSFVKERNEALKPTIEAAKELMEKLWGEGVDLQMILIGGGLGTFLYPMVQDTYTEHEIRMSDTPQLDVSIGYTRFALSRIRFAKEEAV